MFVLARVLPFKQESPSCHLILKLETTAGRILPRATLESLVRSREGKAVKHVCY